MTSSHIERMSRRTFAKGAGALAAAGAIGAATLTISQPAIASEASETSDAKSSSPAAADSTETCDIVVIGAGAAGLAACVEAAELGASVICVESQATSGGNVKGVEGCFGIGSSMQSKQGIEIDPGATIRSELEASQLRASGPGYVDMVHASGANIDWMLENGVTFSDVDAAMGTLKVFHRFASGTGQSDYVEPMTFKAEELGVTFLYETAATSLVQDASGKVSGVLAEGPDGIVQIDAKAVILATGGFADNDEMMAEFCLTDNKISRGGFPGHDGSGHKMAIAAGARSYLSNAAFLAAHIVKGLPGYYQNGKWSFVIGVNAPYAVWVNEKGERFINEDCSAANIMLMAVPSFRNKSTHVIMDAAMVETFMAGDAEAQKQLDDGLASGEIVKADTIEELAEAMGVDADTLCSTIKEYNGFAEIGSDHNYGKAPESLQAIEQAPFYGIHVITEINASVGSIYTDRTFHAIDEEGQPIAGLYVVGVEGAMLWSNIYTINVSGGCNANNVYSGRTAAQDAVSTYLA